MGRDREGAQSERRGQAPRRDHVRLQSDQLLGQVGQWLELSFGPSVLHDDVPALDVAQVLQRLPEGLKLDVLRAPTSSQPMR